MDCDGLSLAQMGQKTLQLATTQQYNYTNRLAWREPSFLEPLSHKGRSTLSTGQKKPKKLLPEGTGYKQEQTWTLYSSF